MRATLLWRGTHAAIAHIGDTRAYLLRDGELTQLTRDHTLGQLLIDEGLIQPEELGSDFRHSLIVGCLDGETDVPADITGHEAAARDRYLLCTSIDRFRPPRPAREILQEILTDERDPQDAADRIAATAFPALQYGGTCIVADVVERPSEHGRTLG